MRALLTAIFSTICFIAQAQVINAEHSSFLISSPGEIMLISGGSTVVSLGMDGKERYTYNERLMADISSIHLTSAIRPMIFFGDIPAFKVLDNTLSAHSEAVELSEFGLENVSLMAPTPDNGYWTFDPVSQQLRRWNEQLIEQVSTGDLRALIGQVVDAQRMKALQNRLYLLDKETGIHVFDFYAGYLGPISGTEGVTDFDVRDKMLLTTGPSGIELTASGSKRDVLFILSPRRTISSVLDSASTVRLSSEGIYAGDGQMIERIIFKD